jgi:hypothetical protein
MVVNVYAKFNLFKKKNIGLLGYRKYLYNMKYDIYQRKFNDGCHVNQEGGEKMKASTITCLLMGKQCNSKLYIKPVLISSKHVSTCVPVSSLDNGA